MVFVIFVIFVVFLKFSLTRFLRNAVSQLMNNNWLGRELGEEGTYINETKDFGFFEIFLWPDAGKIYNGFLKYSSGSEIHTYLMKPKLSTPKVGWSIYNRIAFLKVELLWAVPINSPSMSSLHIPLNLLHRHAQKELFIIKNKKKNSVNCNCGQRGP